MKTSALQNLIAVGTFVLALAASPALAQTDKAAKDSYPIDNCPVTKMKLGAMGDPYVHDHKGREVRFCCKACVKKFEANAEKYLQEMDQEVIRKQKPNYPLETCVVSGQKLGAMGDAYDYVHNNTLVRLCCKGCVKQFSKDPQKYLKQLEQAREQKGKK